MTYWSSSTTSSRKKSTQPVTESWGPECHVQLVCRKPAVNVAVHGYQYRRLYSQLSPDQPRTDSLLMTYMRDRTASGSTMGRPPNSFASFVRWTAQCKCSYQAPDALASSSILYSIPVIQIPHNLMSTEILPVLIVRLTLMCQLDWTNRPLDRWRACRTSFGFIASAEWHQSTHRRQGPYASSWSTWGRHHGND